WCVVGGGRGCGWGGGGGCGRGCLGGGRRGRGCCRRRWLTHLDVPRGGRIERLLGRDTAVFLVLERIGEDGRDLALLAILRCPADRAELGLIARGQRGVFEPVRLEPGGIDVQGQQADGGVADVGRGQGDRKSVV